MKDQSDNPRLDRPADKQRLVLALSANTMGRGDDELGRTLLVNHLYTLTEIEPKPDTLVLLNTAVSLAVEGSDALEALEMLAAQGARILLCGTCLKHFDLRDKIAVGEVSNMVEISETMLSATKLVNL